MTQEVELVLLRLRTGLDASVLVLLLSAKVPRGRTLNPPLGMHQPVHLSISRQSYKARNTKRALEGHHKSNASTFALKLQFDIEIS